MSQAPGADEIHRWPRISRMPRIRKLHRASQCTRVDGTASPNASHEELIPETIFWYRRSPNQRRRISFRWDLREGGAMDIVERWFLITAASCLLVLIGLGFISIWKLHAETIFALAALGLRRHRGTGRRLRPAMRSLGECVARLRSSPANSPYMLGVYTPGLLTTSGPNAALRSCGEKVILRCSLGQYRR